MKKNKEEDWYAALEPQFNTIEDAMPRRQFAAIEAVLYLLYLNDPQADPEKAYLLFSQYQLIGAKKCGPMDHLLQYARYSLGYYRSRKYWQDDLAMYEDARYNAIRAFSICRREDKNSFVKAEEGYPYPYEKRLKEWERFWVESALEKEEIPCADKGRYSYYVDAGGRGGDVERVQVTLARQYFWEKKIEEEETKGKRDPIQISIEELLQTAEQMAAIYPEDYCFKILKGNAIKSVENGEVRISTKLTIQQVTNIVGMVGSGKTTLIKILAFWFHKNHKKLIVVTDTVAESLNLWRYFHKLGIESCPLIGRGERLKYINQIAAEGESCLPGELSRYLTPICLLDGMDGQHEENPVYGREPCYRLNKRRFYRCPFFDVCPGTAMLRECYEKSVVVTTVAGLASARVGKKRESFLEVVLRQADAVIFDESDRAQKTLDQLFMPETSFDSFINESADDCGDFMHLSSQKREEDPVVRRYAEMQMQSTTVMSCILKALRQDLGAWNKITFGDSFSALVLLEDLYRQDTAYRIPALVYQALYNLIDLEYDSRTREDALWMALQVSCRSTDWQVFDHMYTAWVTQMGSDFKRPEKRRDRSIQDARIKLILCLIYFDHFVRELSDAYEACHETSYGKNELFSFLQTRFKEQQHILPSALCGNLFGLKKTTGDDIVLFRQFAFGRSLMKDLPWLRTDAEGNPAGPHVILLSGSSWAEGSYEYHVNRPVNYILEAESEKRDFLRKAGFFEAGFTERVSGAGEERRLEMLRLVTQKAVPLIVEEYNRGAGKILLVVNSYMQAELVQKTLQSALERKGCRARVCRMISDAVSVPDGAGIIRRGEVNRFADRPDEILIAPAMAIERGHNIVDETGHSALGAVFFMVRPMSVPDDVQEKGSKLNGYIEAHFKRGEEEAIFDYNARVRYLATKQWAKMNGSRAYGLGELNEEEQKDIVATLFVLILQIFGRLARVSDTKRPAPNIYFMDGAFRRPEDKSNGFDCLEALGRYLDALMQNEQSAEIAKTLYEPFYTAYKKGIRYEESNLSVSL